VKRQFWDEFWASHCNQWGLVALLCETEIFPNYFGRTCFSVKLGNSNGVQIAIIDLIAEIEGMPRVRAKRRRRRLRYHFGHFLLASCSDHSRKMQRCSARSMGQTDRRTTDGRIAVHCLTSPTV